MSDFDKRNGNRTVGDNRRIFIPPQPGAAPGTPRPQPGSRGPLPPLQPRRPDDAPRTRPRGPGGPGGPGRPGPLPRRGPRPWWKRLKWKRVLGIFAVMLVLLVGGLYWYANSVFNKIEKVEVADVLSSGGGTNYLIVGSDSAEVLEEGDPAFDPDRPAGQRSDTMMLLRFEDGKAKTLPLPRDLYVEIADTGDSQKLNAAYNGGPERLIKTVTDSLGLPVHRYIEVDFASFGALVDGLGGVTIDFPHPASDPMTGLNVTQTGPVELDGQEALAYVRSREYTELIDGRQRKDPTADIGRIERQQKFLRAVFAEIDGASPFTMLRTAGKVSDGLRIDNAMTMFDAARFALKLRGLQPEAQILTVTSDRNEAGAVLILDEAASEPVLSQFR